MTSPKHSDFFDIPILWSTSSINIEYDLRFLQLSHGLNVSHIKDIRHIQLSYTKVAQLTPTERATEIEDTPYSYLSPMGMQFATAFTAAAIPWILVCSFANFIKRK